MTTKEQVNRNIGLSFDFLKQVIKNPDLLDSVKNGTTIDFIEKELGVSLEKEDRIRCGFSHLNKQCLHEECQYYDRHLNRA